MNKRYEANSIVAITVKTGKFNRRVSFMPLSNGKSYYETESKALQKAIEEHSFFKSRMIRTKEEPTPSPSLKGEEKTDNPDVLDNLDAPEAGKLKQIVVAGQSDAVDYLTEKFGISRSKLRSQKAIAEVGKEYGVEFVYS